MHIFLNSPLNLRKKLAQLLTKLEKKACTILIAYKYNTTYIHTSSSLWIIKCHLLFQHRAIFIPKHVASKASMFTRNRFLGEHISCTSHCTKRNGTKLLQRLFEPIPLAINSRESQMAKLRNFCSSSRAPLDICDFFFTCWIYVIWINRKWCCKDDDP